MVVSILHPAKPLTFRPKGFRDCYITLSYLFDQSIRSYFTETRTGGITGLAFSFDGAKADPGATLKNIYEISGLSPIHKSLVHPVFAGGGLQPPSNRVA